MQAKVKPRFRADYRVQLIVNNKIRPLRAGVGWQSKVGAFCKKEDLVNAVCILNGLLAPREYFIIWVVVGVGVYSNAQIHFIFEPK